MTADVTPSRASIQRLLGTNLRSLRTSGNGKWQGAAGRIQEILAGLKKDRPSEFTDNSLRDGLFEALQVRGPVPEMVALFALAGEVAERTPAGPVVFDRFITALHEAAADTKQKHTIARGAMWWCPTAPGKKTAALVEHAARGSAITEMPWILELPFPSLAPSPDGPWGRASWRLGLAQNFLYNCLEPPPATGRIDWVAVAEIIIAVAPLWMGCNASRSFSPGAEVEWGYSGITARYLDQEEGGADTDQAQAVLRGAVSLHEQLLLGCDDETLRRHHESILRVLRPRLRQLNGDEGLSAIA